MLRLVAACCQPSVDAGSVAAEVAALGTGAHDAVVDVAIRHRVAGLVVRALREAGVALGPDAAARLEAASAKAGRQALLQARETVLIQTLFDDADLPSVFFKGAALAAAVWGDLGLKHAKDIDVLIATADVERALALLAARGYAPVRDIGLADGRLHRHIAYFKDLTVVQASSGLAIELHWRLFQNTRLLPGVGLASPRVDVALAGRPVRTFADAPLYAYLCAHGGLSGWFRLKWLADVHALIVATGRSPQALHAEAAKLGAGRSSALALLLCQAWLGLALEPGFARRLARDPVVRLLASNARGSLMHGEARQEIADYSPRWWRIYFAALILKPDPLYALQQVVLYARPLDSLMQTGLPRPLHFLLYLARVPAWVWGRLTRRPSPA